MTRIEITEGRLRVEIEGWDKIWALNSRLEFPVEHVAGARRWDKQRDGGWWTFRGLRAPGTCLPGVILAGTYHRKGEHVFLVTYDNGAQQTISYTLYVTAPVSAVAQVNFQIGDLLSDPTRDLAYVIDNTDQHLLAINTDNGTVSKSVRLASSPGIGHLALSADGLHLYIALTAAQQIQVISLPNLEQSDIINLNFEPYSLAAGADGKLDVSSADNAWEYLRQVDPVSGETLGSFGLQTYYYDSILRLSGDQTSSTSLKRV